MPTNIGIGFSQDRDVELAAQSAAFLSKSNLGTDKIDFTLVFSTVHYPSQQSLPVIRKVLNNTKLIGCSTAGVILSDSIQAHGIGVLTVSSDDIFFGTGSVNDIASQDPHQAASFLAKKSLSDFGQHNRGTFLFFIDGELKNNSSFLKGLQDIFGNVFPIVGAGSSDDFLFENSFQCFEDKSLNDSAVGTLIGGNCHVGVGTRHGWRPLGKPRIIDESEGNIIKRIDGQKAINLYESYLGQDAKELQHNKRGALAILYPLGIHVEGTKEYLLKNAIDILPDGSIVCQGDVPRGSEVHIMIGNKDSCKQAAVEAAQEAQNALLGKQPKLILIIESMARLKLLGRSAFAEINQIKEIFGHSVPIFGMYSNGEISPFQTIEKFKHPHLLNESIIVLGIA